jgi:hypothetical protein
LEPIFSLLFSLNRGTPKYGEWVIACLEGAWSKLVGDRLAAVCRPAAFKNSELVIDLLDKSWEEAVRSVKPELSDKLRTATAGAVKTIAIRFNPARP